MTQSFTEETGGLRYDEFAFGEPLGRLEQDLASVTRARGLQTEPFTGPSLPVFDPALGSDSSPAEDDLRARVAGNLAMSLARILVAAIRDLHASSRGDLAGAVREQQQKLDAALNGLGEIRQKVDVDLAAGMASLRLADAEQRQLIEEQKMALQGYQIETDRRIEELLQKLNVQEQEVAALRPQFSEISPRVAAAVERLDRQANFIRAIHEASQQREEALDELANVLARLKTSWNQGLPEVPAGL
jgi:hypothetical protein